MPGAHSNQQLSSYFDAIFTRLQAIEEHLGVLSAQAGVPYAPPGGDAPADVVALVRAGDQLGAIRRYRELTGADLDTARSFVAGL